MLSTTSLIASSQRPYMYVTVPVLLMKSPEAQGPRSTWLEVAGRIPSQGCPPTLCPVCLGPAGLTGRGGLRNPSGGLSQGVSGVCPTHCPSLGPRRSHPPCLPHLLFPPSEFTSHSGEETQLTVSCPGVKPGGHFPQAGSSRWPASSAEETAIFLE